MFDKARKGIVGWIILVLVLAAAAHTNLLEIVLTGIFQVLVAAVTVVLLVLVIPWLLLWMFRGERPRWFQGRRNSSD